MGPVHCVHYDLYKVISGGPSDHEVHVWNAETGDEISTLDCGVAASSSVNVGVSALVANGGKLVTGTCGEDPGVVRLQDFSNCVNPLVECETEVSNKHSSTSKFWESVFNTMSWNRLYVLHRKWDKSLLFGSSNISWGGYLILHWTLFSSAFRHIIYSKDLAVIWFKLEISPLITIIVLPMGAYGHA